MERTLEQRSLCCRVMVDTLLSDSGEADLILKNGRLINVVTREIYPCDIAVKSGYILLLGDCSGVCGAHTRVIDVQGQYVAPGFIDSHMHFESSMLSCTEFSKLSVASGTTTLIADPHEIGNVLGEKGILAMIEEARGLPNRVLFTVPALTPDVPGLETAGAEIDSTNIARLLTQDCVQGIGEMQGFSNPTAVYENAEEQINDLLASVLTAQRLHRTVEGNAPGLSGRELAAHLIVCGMQTSCHETTTREECLEKLRNGMTVFMREGSTQRNMAQCIRAVTQDGVDSGKLVLVTDDMSAADLLESGHMNEVIRRTVAEGIDPVEAVQMATINAALHFGRRDIGVLAPGKCADICVISDLKSMRVSRVFVQGKEAAQDGRLLLTMPAHTYPQDTKHTMQCGRVKKEMLMIPFAGDRARVRGIGLIENQNLTDCAEETVRAEGGYLCPAPEKDWIAFASIERHGKQGGIGKAFLRGMGLKEGAIAISVAHDTHNLLVCGADYEDMAIAANRVTAMDGGIALVKERRVVGDLRLPFGGLMTDELSAQEVGERLLLLQQLAAGELGCVIHDPFMHLSFASLLTSPKWKLSDRGLVDTAGYRVIPVLVK